MHGIIGRPFAGDFGYPEWRTLRANFRANFWAKPASEKFEIEGYETFFRINAFRMDEHSPAFLTRKTYYIRGHGWSDMTERF